MLYEYRCDSGHVDEVDAPAFQPPPEHVRCRECLSVSTRVYSTAAVKYNGSGFYTTDHR